MGLARCCRRGGGSFLARPERPSGSTSPPFGGWATAARDTTTCATVLLGIGTAPRKKVSRIASRMAEAILSVPHYVGFCSPAEARSHGPRRSAPRYHRPTADCLRDPRSLSVLPGLLASCVRLAGSPRSLLTGRPVRMGRGPKVSHDLRSEAPPQNC